MVVKETVLGHGYVQGNTEIPLCHLLAWLTYFQTVSGLSALFMALACTLNLSSSWVGNSVGRGKGESLMAWAWLPCALALEPENKVLLSSVYYLGSCLRCLDSTEVVAPSRNTQSIHNCKCGNVQYYAWNLAFDWIPIGISPHLGVLELRSTTGCLQFLPPL